jgi:hypothetical protein
MKVDDIVAGLAMYVGVALAVPVILVWLALVSVVAAPVLAWECAARAVRRNRRNRETALLSSCADCGEQAELNEFGACDACASVRRYTAVINDWERRT